MFTHLNRRTCRQIIAYTFTEITLYTHTRCFAVTAVTGSGPVQLLVVVQIDYDISSSSIFLLTHSVAFELCLQSQENLSEPWVSPLTGILNGNHFKC